MNGLDRFKKHQKSPLFNQPLSSEKHKFFITSEGSDGRKAPSEDCFSQNLCFVRNYRIDFGTHHKNHFKICDISIPSFIHIPKNISDNFNLKIGFIIYKL